MCVKIYTRVKFNVDSYWKLFPREPETDLSQTLKTYIGGQMCVRFYVENNWKLERIWLIEP